MSEVVYDSADWRPLAGALAYAVDKHQHQTRKGTTIPYVQHPLAVTSLALAVGATYVEASAAVLHDVAEDAGGKAALAEIRARYGDNVASIVEECSEPLPEAGQKKAPWARRKQTFIAAIPHKSRSACLVSLCDKVCNAGDIRRDYNVLGDGVWERFTSGKDGTLWYYRTLTEHYRARADDAVLRDLVNRLDEIVTGLETSIGYQVLTMPAALEPRP